MTLTSDARARAGRPASHLQLPSR